MVEARGHVGRDEQQLLPVCQLEDGAHEATALRAMVATHAGSEAGEEQQAHPCLVVGWPSSVDELIGGEATAEQGRVTDLLQCHSIELQLRAPSNDARELVCEAQADVECAQPHWRGRVGGRERRSEGRLVHH